MTNGRSDDERNDLENSVEENRIPPEYKQDRRSLERAIEAGHVLLVNNQGGRGKTTSSVKDEGEPLE